MEKENVSVEKDNIFETEETSVAGDILIAEPEVIQIEEVEAVAEAAEPEEVLSGSAEEAPSGEATNDAEPEIAPAEETSDAEVTGETAELNNTPAEETAGEEGSGEAAEAEESEDDGGDVDAEDDGDVEIVRVRKRRRKRRHLTKRPALIIFLIEVLFAILLVTLLMRSVTINSNDKIMYADENAVDSISCIEGKLYINNVTASVPTKGDPEYNISYSWAEGDTDYPTIPRAVIASYRDKEGNLLYELSLYKHSFTPKAEIPEGKTPVNWFNDWKMDDTEGSAMKNEAVEAGQFRGFLVSPADEGDKVSTNVPHTLYFAVSDSKGLSVYVLEGILYSEDANGQFSKAMSACTKSLKKTKQAPETPAEDQSEQSEESEGS